MFTYMHGMQSSAYIQARVWYRPLSTLGPSSLTCPSCGSSFGSHYKSQKVYLFKDLFPSLLAPILLSRSPLNICMFVTCRKAMKNVIMRREKRTQGRDESTNFPIITEESKRNIWRTVYLNYEPFSLFSCPPRDFQKLIAFDRFG